MIRRKKSPDHKTDWLVEVLHEGRPIDSWWAKAASEEGAFMLAYLEASDRGYKIDGGVHTVRVREEPDAS